MGEKRFVLYEHKENYYILENPRLDLDFIEMLGDALTDEEIVDLLNELSDENRQLKEENEKLKQDQRVIGETLDSTILERDTLYKENEQLQKQVENLQDALAEICATLLLNGLEIECNGKNLRELLDDE